MLSHEITESRDDQVYIESLANIIANYIERGGHKATIARITGDSSLLKDIIIVPRKVMPRCKIIPTNRISGSYSSRTKEIEVCKTSKSLETELVHELRHALDDIKSGGMVDVGKKTNSPRKSTTPLTAYQSVPAEINARFSQAIHAIIKDLRDTAPSRDDIRQAIAIEFAARDISTYFPDRLKDKDYRRLISRTMEYIRDRI